MNEKVSDELLHRYEAACQKLNFKGTERDEKILSFAIRHPSFVPCLDAALAFSKHKSLLRKKILVMLAILETTPTYYEQFTTKNYDGLKWIGIFFRGCWAVTKMITGKIILIFI
jgi:hypothetical protein